MSNKKLIIALVIFAVVSWLAMDALLNNHVRRFRTMLKIGDTMQFVSQSVGKPDQIVYPGDQIKAWGTHADKIARQETWIYYVFPRNKNRMVLSFDGKKLDKLEQHEK